MQGLPSAILGDQRELARLPEASVSNPIQAFSLSKGLSSLAASFPVYSRMRTGARRLSYHLVRFSGFSISSRKTIWNGKAAHGFMPAASPKALTAIMATAEHREPCESRGSCTVLGAPGGETPPGDSTMLSKKGLRDGLNDDSC